MNEQPVVEKKSRLRKALRVLTLIAVLGAIVGTVGHFSWKYSGSGEWKQVMDKDGIKIYTRKLPGTTLKEIRAVTRVKTRLMTAVAALAAEHSNEDCSTWIEGCLGQKTIVPYDRKNLTVTELITVKYPTPFSPREFIVAMKVTQEPKTKAVTVDYKAVPQLLPPNACCHRVQDMHNVWVFTPISKDEVAVDYTMHLNQGLPYLMFNRVAPEIVFGVVKELPEHHAKYQNARVATIVE
jgi:hypothetical protein